MNPSTNRLLPDERARLQRSRTLTGILENAVAHLELTREQHQTAEETYRECGRYLAKALGLGENRGDIFPQGSMRLGTVIRPWRDITECFDLDLIFRVMESCRLYPPVAFRDAVGAHLRAKYNGAVVKLAKGWRLDFEKEHDYHLDVIPAMDSPQGGNVIAITDGTNWRDSNPRDYASWFELHAAVLPRFEDELEIKEGRLVALNARIEPLPEYTQFKSPLQRIVQVAKRHRDYHFNKKTKQPDLLTASIVVTTLLTKAYERHVLARVYQSGFELLLVCIEDMPNHLEVQTDPSGRKRYLLRNPSLPEENLVEKWKQPRHAEAFQEWHRYFVAFLRKLLGDASVSERTLLTEALGERAVNSAFAKQAETFNKLRAAGLLTVAPVVGLSVSSGATVPSNTYHGRP